MRVTFLHNVVDETVQSKFRPCFSVTGGTNPNHVECAFALPNSNFGSEGAQTFEARGRLMTACKEVSHKSNNRQAKTKKQHLWLHSAPHDTEAKFLLLHTL